MRWRNFKLWEDAKAASALLPFMVQNRELDNPIHLNGLDIVSDIFKVYCRGSESLAIPCNLYVRKAISQGICAEGPGCAEDLCDATKGAEVPCGNQVPGAPAITAFTRYLHREITLLEMANG